MTEEVNFSDETPDNGETQQTQTTEENTTPTAEIQPAEENPETVTDTEETVPIAEEVAEENPETATDTEEIAPVAEEVTEENPETATDTEETDPVAEEVTEENPETTTDTEEIAPVAEEVTEENPETETEVKPERTKRSSIHLHPKITPNTDDFNWDELGKDTQLYSGTERKQLEETYNQTFSAIVEQKVVEGTIVAKTPREIVVNIGFKSDGVIPANELRYLSNVQIGDKIEVYIISQEDAAGQLLLSHKKARLLKSWDRVNQAYETGEIITGYVKSKTKGGLIVDVFGIESFLPGSQIDVKPIRDYDVFVDKTMEFKVVKINHEYKNVVVSHKALIESELEAQRLEIMAGLEKGQVLEGIVKNITHYGAFIDLGGVDGLIHITDLSWGRINDPSEVIELDQNINVVILDFDEGKKRIALGLKQLTPHPWDTLDPNLKVGDKIKGKVVVIADYGAFLEVAQGVEGLIHVSEMSWSQHLRTAQDFLEVGQEVEAIILTLDREERKMSLGIKQLMPDPWIAIADKCPVGSRHTAIVRNFTSFGIFVELEEGIDGLIHVSDLSWSKKIRHPAEFTKIGEKIDVVVLEMDADTRRLSLGHKQLEENPWDVYETIYTVGSIHRGTVVDEVDKGVIIKLAEGTEGFVFHKGLLREDGTIIRLGETENFKVVEFSKENKKLSLSHSRIWQDIKDAEREAREDVERKKMKDGSKIAKRLTETIEKSTLGDLDAFVSLKADLEMAESKNKKKHSPKSVEAEIKDETLVETETKQDESLVETETSQEDTAVETVTNQEEAIVEAVANQEEVVVETVTNQEEVTVETETNQDEIVAETETSQDEVVAETETETKQEEEVAVETTITEPEQEVVGTETKTTEKKPKKTRAKKDDQTATESTEEKPKKKRTKKETKEDLFSEEE
jgi:small subunit ribosomal protein S1